MNVSYLWLWYSFKDFENWSILLWYIFQCLMSSKDILHLISCFHSLFSPTKLYMLVKVASWFSVSSIKVWQTIWPFPFPLQCFAMHWKTWTQWSLTYPIKGIDLMKMYIGAFQSLNSHSKMLLTNIFETVHQENPLNSAPVLSAGPSSSSSMSKSLLSESSLSSTSSKDGMLTLWSSSLPSVSSRMWDGLIEAALSGQRSSSSSMTSALAWQCAAWVVWN